MKKIFVHGLGQNASSWDGTISHMEHKGSISCPDLVSLLGGREARYPDLYSSFARYCDQEGGQLHLCGISLGGVLALHYTLDRPEEVDSLVLIGTPHKTPKAMLGVQNTIFHLLPRCFFKGMGFCKEDILALGSSMREMDLSGRVRDVRCPVLIVCGKKDRANLRPAQYLSAHIKGARSEILEHTGHVVNEEAPEKLARILDGYYGQLGRHGRPRGPADPER